MTKQQIIDAVGAGRLRRVRIGWYATGVADAKVERAVAAGGVLGCASALAFHGAWDVTGGTVHVHCGHDRTGRMPAGMSRCRSRGFRDDRVPAHAVDDIDVALRCAWWCLPRDELVMVCDSLMHQELATREEIRTALCGLRGVADFMERCDTAESGTESLVRLRLRRHGVELKPQVDIGGVGRVDFLVGERLVIEVDSKAHHTGEENYRKDRERDLKLVALGYVVVRLTYGQVMFHWHEAEPYLLAILRRGDQWWGSRKGARASLDK